MMTGKLIVLKACLIGFVFLTGISACKKDKAINEDVEEIISPTTGSRRQFTLDSIFLYARQVYLWREALPDYQGFNPRQRYENYTPDFTAFQKELFDLSQMKVNPANKLPYENPVYLGNAKYSYLVNGVNAGGSVAQTLATSEANSALLTAVFSVGGSNVGYLMLSSFPKLAEIKSQLDEAFDQLAAAKPADLIIDLRNNGGGYVQTAEYIANLVASSALTGKLMYTEKFNNLMQQGKALILRHQPYLDENSKPVTYNGRAATMADVDFTEAGNTYKFSKKGSLETVKNLYFIVTNGTASSSELLISCLKPYYNVKLVGSRTYGKPIGFFGVVIDDYTVYMSSFLIKNAAGASDYFDGMPVDLEAVPDGQYELGNPNESCLRKALAAIQSAEVPAVTTEKVRRTLASGSGGNQETDAVSNALPLKNGMIEDRRRLLRVTIY